MHHGHHYFERQRKGAVLENTGGRSVVIGAAEGGATPREWPMSVSPNQPDPRRQWRKRADDGWKRLGGPCGRNCNRCSTICTDRPMQNALIAARVQFAFTIMFHYLFPILTMGLGVLIAILKTIQYFGGRDEYGDAARFWARIFAITFAAGVVTGIPMEFQFGTNWARFAQFAG